MAKLSRKARQERQRRRADAASKARENFGGAILEMLRDNSPMFITQIKERFKTMGVVQDINVREELQKLVAQGLVYSERGVHQGEHGECWHRGRPRPAAPQHADKGYGYLRKGHYLP